MIYNQPKINILLPIILTSLFLTSCVGRLNDWTVFVNSQTQASLENTSARRAEQNNLELKAAELFLCNAVSSGALSRRYVDPATRLLYENYCLAVRTLP